MSLLFFLLEPFSSGFSRTVRCRCTWTNLSMFQVVTMGTGDEGCAGPPGGWPLQHFGVPDHHKKRNRYITTKARRFSPISVLERTPILFHSFDNGPGLKVGRPPPFFTLSTRFSVEKNWNVRIDDRPVQLKSVPQLFHHGTIDPVRLLPQSKQLIDRLLTNHEQHAS
jgi:hypothetical protein